MTSNTASAERLSRFLIASNQFAATRGRVKPGAFIPPGDGRLSVHRTSSLIDSEIWTLGNAEVAAPRGKALYGRADVASSSIAELQLEVIPDPAPSLHANVVGWPPDRELQQELALRIAERATLVLVR